MAVGVTLCVDCYSDFCTMSLWCSLHGGRPPPRCQGEGTGRGGHPTGGRQLRGMPSGSKTSPEGLLNVGNLLQDGTAQALATCHCL